MSFSKRDQVFPFKPRAISDPELARIVAYALHQDFGDKRHAIKHISRLTGANLRSIKNWYIGVNVPSSGHLLLLARSSETLLHFILEQIGGEDLRDAFQLLNGGINDNKNRAKLVTERKIYGDNSVTIKVTINPNDICDLNERQLWFLGQLQKPDKTCTKDIAKTWRVTGRTAKRDVAMLVEKKLICFKGAKKTGSYVCLNRVGIG